MSWLLLEGGVSIAFFGHTFYIYRAPPIWSHYHILVLCIRTSLIAQLVKNLPSMKETLVLLLGQEDPLEKG